jgi:hypothetical protein
MRFAVIALGMLLAGCAAQAPVPMKPPVDIAPAAPSQAGGMDEVDSGGCVTGGCSGQLCVDASQGDVVSTCEWTEAYGCYQKAGVCARLASGKCGWVPTPELNACLEKTKK